VLGVTGPKIIKAQKEKIIQRSDRHIRVAMNLRRAQVSS